MARPSAGVGETGVARYINSLQDVSAASETGVARYLKTMAETPAKPITGVERYIRLLSAIESPAPAVKSPTGVQKYLDALPQPRRPAVETGVARYLRGQGLAT